MEYDINIIEENNHVKLEEEINGDENNKKWSIIIFI